MRLIKYLVFLLVCLPTFAQIGPNPGSSLNTWHVEQVYAIGNAVIRNGVLYQSLVTNNVAYDPAGSPSQWSQVFSTSPFQSLTTIGNTGPATLLSGVLNVPQYGVLVANLPSTPNVVYSFIATGDQTGTTIHDISGNGNNATINRASDASPNYWTGTGLAFGGQYLGQSANTVATIGAATPNISDLSWCMTVYIPGWPLNNNSINPMALLNTSTGGSAWTDTAAFVYGSGVLQDVTGVNPGGSLNQGNVAQETGLHTKCWIMGLSGAADTFYVDGVATPLQGSNGSNGGHATGSWLLGNFVASGAVNTPTFYYVAGWSTQLTAAQAQQASIAMTQAVAARGVAISPPTAPLYSLVIRYTGDSITCCAGAATTQWYPSLVSVSGYSGYLNEGQPGFPAVTMAQEAKWRDTPICNTGGSPSVMTILAGTNDGYFGASAGAAYAALQHFAYVGKQAGCQVGVATMISRTGLDTFKDTLNPLIRAGAAQGQFFLIDTAASPNLGADGAYANTTYFNTDQVHPTNAGQSLLAAAFSNAINAYGVPAASSAAPTIYSSNTVTMVSADRFATIIPTAAATATLPDCLGVTGTVYQVFNASAGAFTITFSGLTSEAISGSSTLAQNTAAKFQATLISQSAAGCGWQRVQ